MANKHGGKRQGSGRKSDPNKKQTLAVCLNPKLITYIKDKAINSNFSQSQLVENAIAYQYNNDNPSVVWQEILERVWGNGCIENSDDPDEVQLQIDFEIGECWGRDEFNEETYQYLQNKLAEYPSH